MKTKGIAIIMMVFLFAPFGGPNLKAQDSGIPESDTLHATIEKVYSDLAVLGRLKVSGYLQAQWQKADTAGIESFAGGNFPTSMDNRFSVRRGRFKLAYDFSFSQYGVQVDVTEKGVGIKDAYVSLTDPWLNAFALTAGVMDRPFGYEISYSSGSRESPERSRMFQTLFPGERDLGAKITFQPPKTSRFNFFRIDAGIYNGIGPNAIDFDGYKDFIGHVMINKTNRSEKIKFGFGLSYYNGGWRQGTRYLYNIQDIALPDGAIPAFAVDSTSSEINSRLRREYFGADAQVSLETPFGLTQLRAEYIRGVQPAVAANSTSPAAQPGDAYIRNFQGAYAYWVQNIFQSRFQTVIKFDLYDPNTAVSGDQIGIKVPGKDKATGAADIRYSTLGLGLIYKWNSQVRLTAYFDRVSNETTQALVHSSTLKDLSHDRRDNVFTLRIQYKF